jgi:hypothetical protein
MKNQEILVSVTDVMNQTLDNVLNINVDLMHILTNQITTPTNQNLPAIWILNTYKKGQENIKPTRTFDNSHKIFHY